MRDEVIGDVAPDAPPTLTLELATVVAGGGNAHGQFWLRRGDDPEAGAKMAALGEVQQQLLGKQGMASYLGVIGIPFTEEENASMNEELQEFRDSLEV